MQKSAIHIKEILSFMKYEAIFEDTEFECDKFKYIDEDIRFFNEDIRDRMAIKIDMLINEFKRFFGHFYIGDPTDANTLYDLDYLLNEIIDKLKDEINLD